MARLVLRVERGGRLLGSWSLGDEPLEMTIVDLATGRELGRFSAQGDPGDQPREDGGVDEVPVGGPARRTPGDDFTLPLPEPTETSGPLPTTDEVERRRPRPIPNLAEGRPRPAPPAPAPLAAPAAMEEVETTVTTDLPGHTEEVSIGMPLDGGRLGDLGHTEEISVVPVHTEEVSLTLGDPDDSGFHDPGLRDRLAAADDTDDRAPARAVSPAEVWIRRDQAWRSGGHLEAGQRTEAQGGWVRLGRDGRLVVVAGPRLSGSGTLLDGRTVEITPSTDALHLPPGASVLLRAGDHGLYVRSEPMGDAPTAEPAGAAAPRR